MKKILIVDDATIARKMVANMLDKNKYKVYEASNGLEAIDMYKEVKPDLVTMDITMDGMDGTDALKEIIKLDKDAVVIMASAMGQMSFITESLKYGAKYFLVKPFQKGKFIDTIEKFV